MAIAIFGLIGQQRGFQNEQVAREVCKKLKETGKIEECWFAPHQSSLDQLAIDIVCKTPRGYYFLNVKSSETGTRLCAEEQSGSAHEFFIYPLLVRLGESRAEIGQDLLKLLSDFDPSAQDLPAEIRTIIDSLSDEVELPSLILGPEEMRQRSEQLEARYVMRHFKTPEERFAFLQRKRLLRVVTIRFSREIRIFGEEPCSREVWTGRIAVEFLSRGIEETGEGFTKKEAKSQMQIRLLEKIQEFLRQERRTKRQSNKGALKEVLPASHAA